MKYFKLILVIFMLSNLFTHVNAVEPGKIVGGKVSELPEWFKDSFLDIAEDVEEAKDENKHLMLYMHLTGCPYCYKMVEEGFKNTTNTQIIKDNFDVVAINIRGNKEIALSEDLTMTEEEVRNHYKVNFTPTIVFLDQNNKLVYKVNGYRSVENFKHILNFVKTRAYQNTTLAEFIWQQKRTKHYLFKDHSSFQSITDLSAKRDKPLLVLFEDQYCVMCNRLHNGHLKNPEILKELDLFDVVRFNAESDQAIIDVDGNKTTPSQYVKKLGLVYRPGIVMFDQGVEVMRIDALLYTYHFSGHLRYIGERHYKQYPDSVYDYLRVYRQAILDAGQDIDLSK
ncbi:MAG: thioredoxin [Candidatus Thioglobus sp.]|nr:MAG: thioredoxin [Candidatus Thioglobus sp.]RUM82133.1 MAG: thioredoxin [Candidatus Thioglobus sp.]RUM85643.1 MAG: thioredoxin [Candidatus Thioglobus sp.]RUM85851.1 MAG: thioredoxin [Candidatus Thioglobus sp.]